MVCSVKELLIKGWSKSKKEDMAKNYDRLKPEKKKRTCGPPISIKADLDLTSREKNNDNNKREVASRRKRSPI